MSTAPSELWHQRRSGWTTMQGTGGAEADADCCPSQSGDQA